MIPEQDVGFLFSPVIRGYLLAGGDFNLEETRGRLQS
jgi:hypothetical protein